MTDQQINEAANAYAKEQLGEEQYAGNKDAVLAITEDFKAGISWLTKATEESTPNVGTPADVIDIVFHVMQDGKSVTKRVKLSRQTFINYNAKPKQKWAELYEMIVKDKVYISITDESSSN